MSRLFKRVAQITCWRETVPAFVSHFQVQQLPNEIDITEMRMQFKVTRTLTKHPNACDIWITNLAQTTRVDLEQKPLLVQLEAGYDDERRLLFIGDLRFGMTKLEAPNWNTLLQLGDGDCHHRWARVNRSYGPGTTARTVIKDCAASLGFELPASLSNDPTLDARFDGGTTAFGPATDVLARLLAPFGYSHSIQNNKLQVMRDGDTSNNQAYVIDEEHGMIGTPEFGTPPRTGKPPHVNVKCLLYPEIAPGNLISLTSKVKTGTFKANRVVHTGDTWGRTWETEVELVALS
jgi:hypothetical protein